MTAIARAAPVSSQWKGNKTPYLIERLATVSTC